MPDLRSDQYLKLTTAVPSSWIAHMQTCPMAAVARTRTVTSSGCDEAVNASSVVEWTSLSADGCISVVQTSKTMPQYSQRFRCKGSGENRRVFLEYFAGPACRALLDGSVVATAEWNFTGWLAWLNGSCPAAQVGFSKLDGLSLENRATILSTLPSCVDEEPGAAEGGTATSSASSIDAAEGRTATPSPSSRGTALVTSTTILARSSLASNSTLYPSVLRGGVAQIANSGTVHYFLSKLAIAVTLYASVGLSN